MKNLMVFLLVLAGAGLFFHDKQQTADLAVAQASLEKAQADNAELGQQVIALQAKVKELGEAPAPALGGRLAAPAAPAAPAASTLGGPFGLQGSGGLDRPAYKDGH